MHYRLALVVVVLFDIGWRDGGEQPSRVCKRYDQRLGARRVAPTLDGTTTVLAIATEGARVGVAIRATPLNVYQRVCNMRYKPEGFGSIDPTTRKGATFGNPNGLRDAWIAREAQVRDAATNTPIGYEEAKRRFAERFGGK